MGDSPGHDTTAFSLRQLLRHVRNELGTGDIRRIVEEALPRIKPEHRDQALAEAAAELARAVVVSSHPRIRPARTAAGNLNSGRSAKLAGIRRAWPELRATYACIDASLQLADYSIENLHALAEVLETQALQNAAKAANYRRLAKLMGQAGVSRVGDLPDEVLAAVFRGKAAA